MQLNMSNGGNSTFLYQSTIRNYISREFTLNSDRQWAHKNILSFYKYFLVEHVLDTKETDTIRPIRHNNNNLISSLLTKTWSAQEDILCQSKGTTKHEGWQIMDDSKLKVVVHYHSVLLGLDFLYLYRSCRKCMSGTGDRPPTPRNSFPVSRHLVYTSSDPCRQARLVRPLRLLPVPWLTSIWTTGRLCLASLG